MHKKTIFIVTFCLMSLFMGFTLHLSHAETKEKTEPTTSVRQDMMSIVKNFQALQPYISNEYEFLRPDNADNIRAHLKELAQASDKLAQHHLLSSPNFKLSQGVLEENFKNTLLLFESDSKLSAHWMLRNTANTCVSCHTQTPTSTMALFEVDDSKLKSFKDAEFLFTIRHFAKSLPLYEKAIKDYPKNGLSADSILIAMQRILTIQLKIEPNLMNAKKYVMRWQASKNLPSNQRKLATSWMEELDNYMASKKMPKAAYDNPAAVIDYVKTITKLKERNDPQHPTIGEIWANGLLYQSLQANGSHDKSADLLYWLSISMQGMYPIQYQVLSQNYLKECIQKKPKSPIAQQCFTRYQAQLQNEFKNTASGKIPPQLEQELSNWKAKAY